MTHRKYLGFVENGKLVPDLSRAERREMKGKLTLNSFDDGWFVYKESWGGETTYQLERKSA